MLMQEHAVEPYAPNLYPAQLGNAEACRLFQYGSGSPGGKPGCTNGAQLAHEIGVVRRYPRLPIRCDMAHSYDLAHASTPCLDDGDRLAVHIDDSIARLD